MQHGSNRRQFGGTSGFPWRQGWVRARRLLLFGTCTHTVTMSFSAWFAPFSPSLIMLRACCVPAVLCSTSPRAARAFVQEGVLDMVGSVLLGTLRQAQLTESILAEWDALKRSGEVHRRVMGLHVSVGSLCGSRCCWSSSSVPVGLSLLASEAAALACAAQHSSAYCPGRCQGQGLRGARAWHHPNAASCWDARTLTCKGPHLSWHTPRIVAQ